MHRATKIIFDLCSLVFGCVFSAVFSVTYKDSCISRSATCKYLTHRSWLSTLSRFFQSIIYCNANPNIIRLNDKYTL